VIVSSLNELSGFVVEFDQPLPAGDAGQSIAWSPDGARLAYTVPEGVRVANLPSFGMGEPAVTTVQGGPWTDLYWIGDEPYRVGADGAKAPSAAARRLAGRAVVERPRGPAVDSG